MLSFGMIMSHLFNGVPTVTGFRLQELCKMRTSVLILMLYGNEYTVVLSLISMMHGNEYAVVLSLIPMMHGNECAVVLSLIPMMHGNE